MPAASRPACTSSAWTRFWYIDPEKGIDGVWENSLAAEKPIYNADFTEMTVKLRRGIYWSDGVEFTADDVLYTIQTHMKTNGLRWSAPDPGQRRRRLRARSRHRGVQAEEAELALPCAVHRALERDVDDAEARVREAARSGEVRLRSAGDAGRLQAAQLRPQRQMVHLGASRRLAAHHARPLGQARAALCRLYRSRPARQAGDRAAQPSARHHPRHLARGHVHAGQAGERLRTAGSRASPTRIPTRRCRR